MDIGRARNEQIVSLSSERLASHLMQSVSEDRAVKRIPDNT